MTLQLMPFMVSQRSCSSCYFTWAKLLTAVSADGFVPLGAKDVADNVMYAASR